MPKENSITQEYKALFIEERTRRGLSQADMARALKVTPQWLNQIEQGQTPSADKVIQIYLATSDGWVKKFCFDLLRRMFPTFPWRT